MTSSGNRTGNKLRPRAALTVSVTLGILGAQAVACDVFNDDLEALIDEAEAAGGRSGAGGAGAGGDASGGDDAGADAGDDGSVGAGGAGAGGAGAGGAGAGGVETIAGTDSCLPLASVPMREPDDKFLSVPTAGFTNDFSDLSSCGVARTLGETDGFFRVQLVARSRYHFHVRAAPEQNIAVYLLSSCDERTCVGAIDECPAGTDEHFSFVPTSAGTHILGIDGISNGPTDAPVTFLATRSVCGDGVKQHSEVCDDGNVTPNDDCDNECRAVLGNGAQEMEPNGDRYGSNVVRLTSGTPLSLRGNLGGPCDTDYYLIRVPEGGTLKATMLNAAGTACAGNPATEIRLFNDTLAQLARVEATGACPVLDDVNTAGNLPAGDYFIALRTTGPESPFQYQVRFELSTP